MANRSSKAAGAQTSALAGVERALRVTALVWSALWIVLDIIPALSDPSRFATPAPGYTALFITVLAWALVACRWRHGWALFSASLIGLGVVLAATCRPGDLGTAVPAAMPAMYLAGISAGLLQPLRVALPLAFLSGGVVGGVLVAHAIDLGVWDASRDAILTGLVFVVCDTLGVSAARRALVSSAALADASAVSAARAAEQSVAERAAAEETSRLARVLHDGAINTLAAIASGTCGSNRDAIRTRCASDAAALRLLRTAQVPDEAGQEGSLRVPEGLHVEFESAIGCDPLAALDGVSPDVRRALLAASSEALTNVAKHAGVGEARLAVISDEQRIRIRILDSGIGFDPLSVSRGRGIEDSIVARCAEVGACVHVSSASGQGTVVDIECPRPDAERKPTSDPLPDRSQALLPAAVMPLARGVSYALLIEAALSTVITVHSVAGWRSAGAVILLGFMSVGAQRGFQRSAELRAGWAVALLAAVPIVLWAPGSWLAGEARVGPAWWGSVGCLIPMVHLIFLSRQRWMTWAWFVVYAASLILFVATLGPDATSHDVSQAAAVCFLDGLVGGVMLLLRRGVHRNTERADRALGEETTMRSLAGAEARRADVRNSHRGAALESAEAQLSSIADGSANPFDPRVRDACAREESYLRELITLPVTLVRLGPRLAESLLLAHARAVYLSIRAAETADAPDHDTTVHLDRIVRAAVESAKPGESVVVGVFRSHNHWHATVVGPLHCAPALQATLNRRGGTIAASIEPVDDQTLFEMWWPPA
jgi:signal transduction histidine kinase